MCVERNKGNYVKIKAIIMLREKGDYTQPM